MGYSICMSLDTFVFIGYIHVYACVYLMDGRAQLAIRYKIQAMRQIQDTRYKSLHTSYSCCLFLSADSNSNNKNDNNKCGQLNKLQNVAGISVVGRGGGVDQQKGGGTGSALNGGGNTTRARQADKQTKHVNDTQKEEVREREGGREKKPGRRCTQVHVCLCLCVCRSINKNDNSRNWKTAQLTAAAQSTADSAGVAVVAFDSLNILQP